MRKQILSVAVLALLSSTSWAQTLFTLDKEKVSKDEFLRFYNNKNTDKANAFSENNIDEYIELFSLYKMKIKEAKTKGLDTNKNLVQDFNNYKYQLAKSYIVDQSTQLNIVKEAYDKSKEEIEIAHIQISYRGNDTINAFNRANELYAEIQSGKFTFEEAALKYSDDKQSGKKNGYVGYITPFTVFYPIENVAYSTQAGSISRPVKTDIGYHIVKVISKRPAQGRIQVAQILIRPENFNDEKLVKEAENKANQIYNDIKSGKTDFTSAVRKYSEDIHSIGNDGVLSSFNAGKYIKAFEDAAFALKNPNDIAPPVQTPNGFHIIRLVKKFPHPTFEEAKPELLAKLKKDARLEKLENEKKAALLSKSKYSVHNTALEEIKTMVAKDTSSFLSLNNKMFDNKKATIIEINGKKYSQSDFITFLRENTDGNLYGKKEQTVQDLFNLYNERIVAEYQINHIQKSNNEFNLEFKDFTEAATLFTIMEKEVWNKAVTDNEGLYKYYQDNSSKYAIQGGFKGNIFECATKENLEKLISYHRAGVSAFDAVTKVNNIITSSDKITYHGGKYENKSIPVAIKELVENKFSEVYKAPNGFYFAILPEEIYKDNEILDFSEARGKVVSDYQLYLEQDFNNQLKKKYKITIDPNTRKSLIKK